MKTISVFCDDASIWESFSLHFNINRLITSYGEPYLSFTKENFIFNIYLYGNNNTNEVPKKIINVINEDIRPDIIFYDNQNDKILLYIEETMSAPVGNALKQRIPRVIYAILHEIPMLYVSPEHGMDNSQNCIRKITGVLSEIMSCNKNSFITHNKFSLLTIINDIIENNLKKYTVKYNFNLQSLGKRKVSVKKNNYEYVNNIINMINSDDNIHNIIEESGNIFLVKKKCDLSQYLNIDHDFILLLGSLWKRNGKGYSDPSSGGIYMTYLINKMTKNYPLYVVNTKSGIDYKKVLSNNNKMVFSLSKTDGLITESGIIKNIRHNPVRNFKFKQFDESISTYTRVMDLLGKGVKIDFVQYPHGSWSSNDFKNTTKRDTKRCDLIYGEIKEEGKVYLSQINDYIKKYGDDCDYYYYIYEDTKPMVCDKKLIKLKFI